MKIIYSIQKDEVLLTNKDGLFEDFAENLWNPKDKFFKAMFHPIKVINVSSKQKKPIIVKK